LVNQLIWPGAVNAAVPMAAAAGESLRGRIHLSANLNFIEA
jgi:hypothetical protein